MPHSPPTAPRLGVSRVSDGPIPSPSGPVQRLAAGPVPGSVGLLAGFRRPRPGHRPELVRGGEDGAFHGEEDGVLCQPAGVRVTSATSAENPPSEGTSPVTHSSTYRVVTGSAKDRSVEPPSAPSATTS